MALPAAESATSRASSALSSSWSSRASANWTTPLSSRTKTASCVVPSRAAATRNSARTRASSSSGAVPRLSTSSSARNDHTPPPKKATSVAPSPRSSARIDRSVAEPARSISHDPAKTTTTGASPAAAIVGWPFFSADGSAGRETGPLSKSVLGSRCARTVAAYVARKRPVGPPASRRLGARGSREPSCAVSACVGATACHVATAR